MVPAAVVPGMKPGRVPGGATPATPARVLFRVVGDVGGPPHRCELRLARLLGNPLRGARPTGHGHLKVFPQPRNPTTEQPSPPGYETLWSRSPQTLTKASSARRVRLPRQQKTILVVPDPPSGSPQSQHCPRKLHHSSLDYPKTTSPNSEMQNV